MKLLIKCPKCGNIVKFPKRPKMETYLVTFMVTMWNLMMMIPSIFRATLKHEISDMEETMM